jgi:hypothetical protein
LDNDGGIAAQDKRSNNYNIGKSFPEVKVPHIKEHNEVSVDASVYNHELDETKKVKSGKGKGEDTNKHESDFGFKFGVGVESDSDITW